MTLTNLVIASEPYPVIASEPYPVIASEAKQSPRNSEIASALNTSQ